MSIASDNCKTRFSAYSAYTPHKMTKINLSDDLLNLVNLDTSPEINYNAYDYLFTDWSGIALEFYYFKRTPCFSLNDNQNP